MVAVGYPPIDARSAGAPLSKGRFGAAFAALGSSLATTVIGAILIGLVLAPLGTYYSLVLDQLAAPQERPEVFALLRTANAVGIIFASAVLTAVSLSSALIVVTCTMLAVTLTVGFVPAGFAGATSLGGRAR